MLYRLTCCITLHVDVVQTNMLYNPTCYMLQAAGRHQCSYLINLHIQEFILAGGDPTWLNGLDSIPKKLRHLYEINKILAHRPWLITKSHIEVGWISCLVMWLL